MEEKLKREEKYNKMLEKGIKNIEEHKEIHSKNKQLILSYLRDAKLGKTIIKGQ